jgi:hypothetical protein
MSIPHYVSEDESDMRGIKRKRCSACSAPTFWEAQAPSMMPAHEQASF